MTDPIDLSKPIEVFNTTARVIRPAMYLARLQAPGHYEIVADDVRWAVGPDNTILGPADYTSGGFPPIWVVRNPTH